MSKLLSYLQALLDRFVNRSETNFISDQSLPAGAKRVTQTITELTGTILPTANGWLSLQANCTRLVIQTNFCRFVIPLQTKAYASVVIPVRKGWGVSYEIEGSALADISCSLVPSVGADV